MNYLCLEAIIKTGKRSVVIWTAGPTTDTILYLNLSVTARSGSVSPWAVLPPQRLPEIGLFESVFFKKRNLAWKHFTYIHKEVSWWGHLQDRKGRISVKEIPGYINQSNFYSANIPGRSQAQWRNSQIGAQMRNRWSRSVTSTGSRTHRCLCLSLIITCINVWYIINLTLSAHLCTLLCVYCLPSPSIGSQMWLWWWSQYAAIVVRSDPIPADIAYWITASTGSEIEVASIHLHYQVGWNSPSIVLPVCWMKLGLDSLVFWHPA